jgi:hypothetical protein
MVDAWHQSSGDESNGQTTDQERPPWRAPVIKHFALERTLHGGQSSGDFSSPHTD